MRIVLFQTNIIWEQPAENLINYSNILDNFFKSKNENDYPDILIFPEFFVTGFSMNTDLAETADGPSFEWLSAVSTKYQVAVVSSFPVKEGGNFYNRCFFIKPDGKVETYDKRHLFRMGDEGSYFSPGHEQKIISYKSWNICLNVCYDLRFPVWSRNVNLRYDLLLNVASWPHSRMNVVEHLVKARAIENLSYHAFLNRVGESPVTTYNGQSRIVDYLGRDIAHEEKIGDTSIFTAYLDLDELKRFRKKFPAWMDADNFILEYDE